MEVNPVVCRCSYIELLTVLLLLFCSVSTDSAISHPDLIELDNTIAVQRKKLAEVIQADNQLKEQIKQKKSEVAEKQTILQMKQEKLRKQKPRMGRIRLLMESNQVTVFVKSISAMI